MDIQTYNGGENEWGNTDYVGRRAKKEKKLLFFQLGPSAAEPQLNDTILKVICVSAWSAQQAAVMINTVRHEYLSAQ